MTLRPLFLLVSFLLCSALLTPTSGRTASNRYDAPDFTLTDLQGNTVQLLDLRGSVVPIMFWTIW